MSAPEANKFATASGTKGSDSFASTTPLLPGTFPASSTSSSSNDLWQPETSGAEAGPKLGNRNFWNKKKNEERPRVIATDSEAGSISSAPRALVAALRPVSPFRPVDSQLASASPQRSHPYGSPMTGIRASSPRPHSPASSQIFERSVQEDIPPEASPHLPTHIITENYIPPALDASSEAITNDQLDPDSVEIVTHATHQPAAVTITGVGADQSMASSLHEDDGHFHQHSLHNDNTSNYRTVDSQDVRRLSFVSFADVVHGEHAEAELAGESVSHRGSMQLPALPGHPSIWGPRSPSPVRSPVSSHGPGTSPPTSVTASLKGLETSPNRGVRRAGSPPLAHSPPLSGELNVETMRQALRRTGSGELSGARSQPMSAVGNDDGAFTDRPFR